MKTSMNIKNGTRTELREVEVPVFVSVDVENTFYRRYKSKNDKFGWFNLVAKTNTGWTEVVVKFDENWYSLEINTIDNRYVIEEWTRPKTMHSTRNMFDKALGKYKAYRSSLNSKEDETVRCLLEER